MDIRFRVSSFYINPWPSRLGHHFRIYTLTLLKCRFICKELLVLKALCVLFSVLLAYVLLTILQETLKEHLCVSFGRSLCWKSLIGMISAWIRNWREFKVLNSLEVLLESFKDKDCDKIKEGVFTFLYKSIGVCTLNKSI